MGQLGLPDRFNRRNHLSWPVGNCYRPFGGAFIGELLGDRSARDALKSGIGALIGFLVGTVFKVVVCGYFVWCFVKALI